MPAETGAPRGVSYHDYHRTIIGYHGTTAEVAERLVDGEPFRPSDNDDDWFGRGISFWEYAPKQAWWWTRDLKRNTEPAVVGAVIRLGHCFDLLDPLNVATLRQFYEQAVTQWVASGIPVPENVHQHKRLDCAVFNLFYAAADRSSPPLETARAVYVPTGSARRIWKRSWIYEQAHIQVCVRQAENILAVWRVRSDGRYGKDQPGRSPP
jgi:hypothetical protein